MIGVVIITHGELGQAFVSVMESIVGTQQNVEPVPILATEDVDQQREIICQAIERVDSGKGVVLLTDLFGGTPSNLALSILGVKKVEVLAGVNLPMLLKLISIRSETTLRAAVEQAQEEGRKYIHIASAFLENQGTTNDK